MKFSVRLGVLIGHVLHHYDSSLFGWIAPFLAPVIFPHKNSVDGLLLMLAFLPLNYLIKPLGALFWGWVGDRFGRKPVIISTLAGISVLTCAMGCLPLNSYTWMLLAFCRMLQGFFSIGEERGSSLFFMEGSTSSQQRTWASALYDASGVLGIFLASFAVLYGGIEYWRLLFLVSASASLLAVCLRIKAKETLIFPQEHFSWKVFWQERGVFFQIIIVSGFSYANYFVLSVFFNTFIPQITNVSKEEMLIFNTHLLWIDFFLLLGFGKLCCWIKKEYLMATAAFAIAVCGVPLFMKLQGAGVVEVAVIRLVLMICGVALAAPYHAWSVELLKKKSRLLISGVGSAIGAQLLGAPMPLVAAWLVTKTGRPWIAACPLVLLGVVSGTVILSVAIRRWKNSIPEATCV